MPKLPFIDYQVQNPMSSDIVLNNAQGSPLTIISLDSSTVKSAILDYSIVRGSTIEVGRMLIATDGNTLSFERDQTNNADTGVILFGSLDGSMILVKYVSNNTGQTGTFKYSQKVVN